MYNILIYYTAMPHVSKIKLDSKVEKNLIKTLEFVLTKLTKEEEMNGFLLSLLTPTERLMLAKRLAMTILLKEKLPDVRIASALNVTRATISKMELFLETRGRGFDYALSKLQKEKVMQEFREVLKSLASYAVKAAGGRI